MSFLSILLFSVFTSLSSQVYGRRQVSEHCTDYNTSYSQSKLHPHSATIVAL